MGTFLLWTTGDIFIEVQQGPGLGVSCLNRSVRG